MKAAALRMEEMIDGLLRLAKLPHASADRTEFDLTVAANRVLAAYAERDPLQQVQVTIAPQMTAWADARLMHHVLENLLSNAWMFTSKVAHARIEVGVQPSELGAPAFFVRDNGAGSTWLMPRTSSESSNGSTRKASSRVPAWADYRAQDHCATRRQRVGERAGWRGRDLLLHAAIGDVT